MINVACAIILNKERKILAAQRSFTMSLPLKWEFPGGKIESNETPEQCIIREIKEELDIKISIIRPFTASQYIYPTVTINLIPSICQYVSGEIFLKEHANYKWLNPNELLDLDWAEADIPIVKNYLNHFHVT